MASRADINSNDYYQVLGLDKDASEAEVAKAYKKLALKHHPDKNPDRKEKAEEEFKKLTEAYDVLRCAEKRKIYDQCGKTGLDGSGGGNPQSGEPGFSFSGGRGQGQTSMSREEADMIFSAFFGGADPFGGVAGNAGSQFVFTSGSDGAAPFGGFEGFQGMNLGGMSFGRGFPSSSGFRPPFRARSAAGQRASARPRSRRAQSRPQRRTRQCMIPNDTAVVIQGLRKAPEHNGKVGHIVSWDDVKGRYEIQVRLGDDDMWLGDDKLWLRPQNITQMCTVEVSGLINKPELNGSNGVIQNYDQSKNRYMVSLDGGSGSFALSPANCILKPGTSITMNGLSNPQYNGQAAQIVSVDRAAARYAVACEDGKHIRIKFQNVLC